MTDVVVVDSVRTGLAKSFRGSFNLTRSDDMLAHCIDSLLERNPSVSADEVEDVVVGAASHAGEQDGNLARLAVVLSKLPITTAGMTINRFCSSGLQSIAIAANQIASGQTQVAIAGGVDSISMRNRQTTGKAEQNKRLIEEKPEVFMAMGNTAEVVARRYQVTREMQDVYALQSQQRYANAVEQGWIGEEIVPMNATMLKVDKETGDESRVEVSVDKDECNRPQTTLDGLSGLAPAFEEDGTVTAGNASQLSDGASMTMLMSSDRAAQLGIEPIGIYRGFTVAACEPDEMGIGPVFAIPRLLQNAGLKQDDIDVWELNEAFASQCVYCRDQLDIDNEKYNVNGGSISIGHPFGMTGSRCTGAVLRELQRREQRYGVVTMCIGGGQGAAGLFERA
ncbi:MAG: thiolase family protein [Pseudomonadota bacterium]|jgi:acetyl-CoA acyltransferase|uniref:acetyl-CoA C-acyltransferase n=2 Tax=marine metagenome TaxID=408172 RepID=A0A381P9F9_9ZZZZ|nr:acetyl-CoA C-acyltransferase [Gammaproteobacteria bacterium]MEC8833671.1 thiolase family protein [Pseudomonadota bacterium]MEC8867250.1 thiolase family protein [Pseudomonadota bacterium]MEC9285036.1 thiolase family protein [Pseudomonadota bacterium]MEE3183163.1 thiolase family protein [Pseudomonadota bacterium]|tara:strand:+ start:4040 stop:5224 length:1185 start_codon:yes stop_codon:yes gene_type:complete